MSTDPVRQTTDTLRLKLEEDDCLEIYELPYSPPLNFWLTASNGDGETSVLLTCEQGQRLAKFLIERSSVQS